MMKKYSAILILTLLGCSMSQSKSIKTLTNIDSNITYSVKPLLIENDGGATDYADIRLSFTESITTDNAIIYKVNSTYDNKNIGFELSVPRQGFSNLTINSVGIISDNFIHVLQKLYKLKIDTTSKFVETISGDCINMGNYIDSLKKQTNGEYEMTVENKVFLQGKSDDDYAEVYLNINDSEHWIELKEKDEEYRPIIVRQLTRQQL